MRLKWTTILLAPALLIGAAGSKTPEKPKDACAPPPGGTAPALPAHIMTGQGTINFPITTSSPKAQEFFNQGVAQLHSFWAVEAERSLEVQPERSPPPKRPRS